MNQVIFLYSDAVENQLSREQFAALWDGKCSAVCAETLRPEDLEGAKAVVYAPGKWVCDETFAALCHFYKQGGTLILLGAKALSQPYAVRESKVVPLCESVDYIRSLGPVEQYIQTFAPKNASVRVQGEEYAALRLRDGGGCGAVAGDQQRAGQSGAHSALRRPGMRVCARRAAGERRGAAG